MSQEKPNRIDQTEGSQNSYRRSIKPKRVEVKPLQVLDNAMNKAGEVFNTEDLIQVMSPWGSGAIAKIQGFYEDTSGNAWAHYIPSESREGWDWAGGCILAALLVKAVAE